ncbi:MAG: ComF family protein [Holophagaceae bacterium]|nr:ComF family protein [Holophagaceae bacterium]
MPSFEMPKKLPFLGAFLRLRSEALRCRCCLGELREGSEAGLCGRCWSGLAPLPPDRCGRCALAHGSDRECPEPVAWTHGDALWDYHSGRPALGALLMPGIKAGEWGWRAALLGRAGTAPLPEFASGVDLVTTVPAHPWRRWSRGFDLAEDVARILAGRIAKPFAPLLRKSIRSPRQAGLPESRRRRLPQKAFALDGRADIKGRTILLVDDVWTTGTTLLRCAQRLRKAGATEIRVLTLFRAL